MSNLPYRLKQNDLKISFPKNITTASEKTDGLVHQIQRFDSEICSGIKSESARYKVFGENKALQN